MTEPRSRPARIAGRLVATDDVIEVANPYDGSVVATVPRCSAAHVDEACVVAQAALDRGDFPQHERARVLERAAELLRDRVEDFARTIALEAGKPIRTARAEAQRGVDTLVFAAVEARTLAGEMVPVEASEAGDGKLAFALRVPVGVVAAISPFNFPLNLVAHKLAPAIAAGCPVVLKPAGQTPLSALDLVDLLVEAGLPPDWVSVVTGSGAEVGDPLVEHELPRVISFTGSPAVGWAIAAKAPQKRVALELGSNSPLIVEPDADLAAVAAKVRVAGFAHAGQSCISTQRIFVQRDAHPEFVDALTKEIESIVVGDPLDESTEVGPLIDPGEAQRVRSWIDAAVAGGGRLVAGGELSGGVLTPALVDRAPVDSDLCAKEAFGPVVVTAAYDDFDEALALADASGQKLHAGIFTNDLSKALRAVRRLNFGGVLVNEVPTWRADQQPYGGVLGAGNTREGPRYAVETMTELRFVTVQGGD